MAKAKAKDAKGSEDSEHLAEFVGTEITCPVCLEVYDDPKCLPNCAHNVCVTCLRNLAKRNRKKGTYTVECPECRTKSTVPTSGVTAFPTNHLLKRLIENSPEYRARRAFEEALKYYREQKEKIEEELHALTTIPRNVLSEESKKRLKDQIKSEARRVKKTIEEEERKLLSQVDEIYSEKSYQSQFEMKHREVNQLYAKVSKALEGVDKVKEEHDWEKFQKSKEIFEKQFQDSLKVLEASVNNLRSMKGKAINQAATAKFTAGKVDKSSKILGVISCDPPEKATSKSETTYGDGEVIRHIDTDFIPKALSVSPHTGEIAVLDAENNRVHIFTAAGDHQKEFDVKYGDLKEIAYSKNDDIVVLNQEKNRLLHFDKDGAFIRKFVKSPNSSVRFQKLTTGVDGHYVLTTLTEDGPGILMYDSERCHKLAFTSSHFQGSKLAAVHHEDKYYVTDHSSTIKIFDKKGKFLQETKSLGGSAANPSKLYSLAVDDAHDCLVCISKQSNQNTILAVKTDGNIVSKAPIGGSLNSIAMSKGSNSLVATFHMKKFIQILPHKV